MKRFLIVSLFFLAMALSGCAPLLVGGGATGAYKVGTDERTAGRQLDDSAITFKVNTGMISDPAVKARQIDVDTLDGVVTLTGVVETEEEAKRAVEIAGKVPGVLGVNNNLQIGSKTFGQMISDKTIGTKIKTRLIKEPGIRSLNIDVDVNRGVVTLTGVVGFPEQKEKVIEIARSTGGTVRVVDNIKVEYPK